jgi:hypothetical protein
MRRALFTLLKTIYVDTQNGSGPLMIAIINGITACAPRTYRDFYSLQSKTNSARDLLFHHEIQT